MAAFLIFASGCEVYSSLFSCCLSRGGNKFSIKFAGKMLENILKTTSSSVSSIVGTLWTVHFCIFFVLT